MIFRFKGSPGKMLAGHPLRSHYVYRVCFTIPHMAVEGRVLALFQALTGKINW